MIIQVLQRNVKANWGNLETPPISVIVKGWFAFRFGSQEEIDKIQSKGPSLFYDKLIQATQWLFFLISC